MFSNMVSSSFTLKSFNPNSLSVTYFNQKLSLMCLTYIKVGYFCLLSSIILKNISLAHATRKYHILKLGSSKLSRMLSQLLLFLLIINFLLIGIVNPGMLNPGPGSLKICYQNVQRLIPIKEDITQLQRDINILYFWSLNNKMKFHPDKCKVVTIKHRPSPLAMLPFVAYHYHLGENLLSYADSEKDLGVHINKSCTFNEQCEILLTKANQKFGILKRTCHFVTCKNRRRVLYLALVRSQFEHCSPVWRPRSITMTNDE